MNTSMLNVWVLILRLKISNALLKLGIFLREGRVGFLETGNLNLLWRHNLSIVADELCSLYAHIFGDVKWPNEKS